MALFYTIKNLSVNILEVLLRTPPTDTIGAPLLTCGQESAVASSKDNAGQNINKVSETQKHPVRTYSGIIPHLRKIP